MKPELANQIATAIETAQILNVKTAAKILRDLGVTLKRAWGGTDWQISPNSKIWVVSPTDIKKLTSEESDLEAAVGTGKMLAEHLAKQYKRKDGKVVGEVEAETTEVCADKEQAKSDWEGNTEDDYTVPDHLRSAPREPVKLNSLHRMLLAVTNTGAWVGAKLIEAIATAIVDAQHFKKGTKTIGNKLKRVVFPYMGRNYAIYSKMVRGKNKKVTLHLSFSQHISDEYDLGTFDDMKDKKSLTLLRQRVTKAVKDYIKIYIGRKVKRRSYAKLEQLAELAKAKPKSKRKAPAKKAPAKRGKDTTKNKGTRGYVVPPKKEEMSPLAQKLLKVLERHTYKENDRYDIKRSKFDVVSKLLRQHLDKLSRTDMTGMIYYLDTGVHDRHHKGKVPSYDVSGSRNDMLNAIMRYMGWGLYRSEFGGGDKVTRDDPKVPEEDKEYYGKKRFVTYEDERDETNRRKSRNKIIRNDEDYRVGQLKVGEKTPFKGFMGRKRKVVAKLEKLMEVARGTAKKPVKRTARKPAAKKAIRKASRPATKRATVKRPTKKAPPKKPARKFAPKRARKPRKIIKQGGGVYTKGGPSKPLTEKQVRKSASESPKITKWIKFWENVRAGKINISKTKAYMSARTQFKNDVSRTEADHIMKKFAPNVDTKFVKGSIGAFNEIWTVVKNELDGKKSIMKNTDAFSAKPKKLGEPSQKPPGYMPEEAYNEIKKTLKRYGFEITRERLTGGFLNASGKGYPGIDFAIRVMQGKFGVDVYSDKPGENKIFEANFATADEALNEAMRHVEHVRAKQFVDDHRKETVEEQAKKLKDLSEKLDLSIKTINNAFVHFISESNLFKSPPQIPTAIMTSQRAIVLYLVSKFGVTSTKKIVDEFIKHAAETFKRKGEPKSPTEQVVEKLKEANKKASELVDVVDKKYGAAKTEWVSTKTDPNFKEELDSEHTKRDPVAAAMRQVRVFGNLDNAMKIIGHHEHRPGVHGNEYIVKHDLKELYNIRQSIDTSRVPKLHPTEGEAMRNRQGAVDRIIEAEHWAEQKFLGASTLEQAHKNLDVAEGFAGSKEMYDRLYAARLKLDAIYLASRDRPGFYEH